LYNSPVNPEPQATAGSPHYMAPELFQPGAVYSFASDLWALGVVMYECFAGVQPFRRELFADLQRDIESAPPPPLKGGCEAAIDSAAASAADSLVCCCCMAILCTC
jgi:serine/threonine protein kinase